MTKLNPHPNRVPEKTRIVRFACPWCKTPLQARMDQGPTAIACPACRKQLGMPAAKPGAPCSQTILCSAVDGTKLETDFTLEVEDEAPAPGRQSGPTLLLMPSVLNGPVAGGGGSFAPPTRPHIYRLLGAALAGAIVAAALTLAAVVPLLSAGKNEAVAEGPGPGKQSPSKPSPETGPKSKPSDDRKKPSEKPGPAGQEKPKKPALQIEPVKPKTEPRPAENKKDDRNVLVVPQKKKEEVIVKVPEKKEVIVKVPDKEPAKDTDLLEGKEEIIVREP